MNQHSLGYTKQADQASTITRTKESQSACKRSEINQGAVDKTRNLSPIEADLDFFKGTNTSGWKGNVKSSRDRYFGSTAQD